MMTQNEMLDEAQEEELQEMPSSSNVNNCDKDKTNDKKEDGPARATVAEELEAGTFDPSNLHAYCLSDVYMVQMLDWGYLGWVMLVYPQVLYGLVWTIAYFSRHFILEKSTLFESSRALWMGITYFANACIALYTIHTCVEYPKKKDGPKMVFRLPCSTVGSSIAYVSLLMFILPAFVRCLILPSLLEFFLALYWGCVFICVHGQVLKVAQTLETINKKVINMEG